MLSRQIIFCVVTGVSVVVTGKIIVDDDGGAHWNSKCSSSSTCNEFDTIDVFTIYTVVANKTNYKNRLRNFQFEIGMIFLKK